MKSTAFEVNNVNVLLFINYFCFLSSTCVLGNSLRTKPH